MYAGGTDLFFPQQGFCNAGDEDRIGGPQLGIGKIFLPQSRISFVPGIFHGSADGALHIFFLTVEGVGHGGIEDLGHRLGRIFGHQQDAFPQIGKSVMLGGKMQREQKLCHIADRIDRGCRGLDSLAQIFDPGGDGIDVTGLSHQIFDTQTLGTLKDIRRQQRSHRHDHGMNPGITGPFQQGKAVQLRQHQIQNQDIGMLPTEQLPGFCTGSAAYHLIAALEFENNLNEDGTVNIPKALQPYMGGQEVIK